MVAVMFSFDGMVPLATLVEGANMVYDTITFSLPVLCTPSADWSAGPKRLQGMLRNETVRYCCGTAKRRESPSLNARMTLGSLAKSGPTAQSTFTPNVPWISNQAKSVVVVLVIVVLLMVVVLVVAVVLVVVVLVVVVLVVVVK